MKKGSRKTTSDTPETYIVGSIKFAQAIYIGKGNHTFINTELDKYRDFTIVFKNDKIYIEYKSKLTIIGLPNVAYFTVR